MESCDDHNPFLLLTLTHLDQRAIDTLLRLAENYQGHATNVTAQSKQSVKGAHTDNGLKNAEADLKVHF